MEELLQGLCIVTVNEQVEGVGDALKREQALLP